MKLKSKKYVIVIYLIVSALFFILEPFLYQAVKWAQVNSLGAEMGLGMGLPLLLTGFILFAASALFYFLFTIKTYKWESLIPLFIVSIAI